ncbi:MAG TPA: TIGR03067 domain-containing protein [Gemmataceae bacterium]|nr:TIGR03067 domain-containing protein [Gemmataceae bacterium]
MVWKIVAVLAVGFLLGADETKKDDKDKDGKKLEGTWIVVSMEHGGKKAPDEAAKGVTLIFAADGKVSVKTPDKEIKGSYKLGAGKKAKEITLEATAEKTLYGIYKIDGDSLTICAVDTSADERPTEFATKDGSEARLVVLKREKK